jgi:parvulin-like peptidyl-prolyl isomerase
VTISALLSAALLSGCAKKPRVVAKVGDLVINGDDFKEGFISRYRTEANAQRQSFKERQDYLNQLIEKKLMLVDAYRKGLDKKEEIVKAGQDALERVAVQQLLYEKEIIGKVINEQTLKDYYSKSGEEIHARHILIRTDPVDSTQWDKAKVRADSIYQAVKGGADFAELAKSLSDDKTNSPQGGDLGYFKWGRMLPEFQEVAFALKINEISPPVKTNYGYHIIQLLDRRKVEMKPYEEEKAQLKEELKRQKYQELRKMADEYIEQLKKDFELVVYDDSLKAVFDKVNKPGTPQNVSLFSSFTENERKMPVAKWKQGVVTVTDLDQKIGGQGMGYFRQAEDFKMVIDGILVPKMLSERAKERKLFNAPEAIKASKEATEAMMVQQIQKQEIDDKINFDDLSLKAYYEKNLGKYMTEPMVTIREILLDDENQAKKLLAQAKAGANFKKMARKYTTRANTKSKDGLLGPFSKNTYGRIGREAHMLQVGEFCQQPVRMGRKYSIFKVEEKTPAKQKTFEECRSEVERDYRMEMKTGVNKKWLDQLRAEIPVKIYEKNLRKVLTFAEEKTREKTELKEEPRLPSKKGVTPGVPAPATPAPGPSKEVK